LPYEMTLYKGRKKIRVIQTKKKSYAKETQKFYRDAGYRVSRLRKAKHVARCLRQG